MRLECVFHHPTVVKVKKRREGELTDGREVNELGGEGEQVDSYLLRRQVQSQLLVEVRGRGHVDGVLRTRNISPLIQ